MSSPSVTLGPRGSWRFLADVLTELKALMAPRMPHHHVSQNFEKFMRRMSHLFSMSHVPAETEMLEENPVRKLLNDKPMEETRMTTTCSMGTSSMATRYP